MKKKMVSMLLALALVVTGIPADMASGTAYAAEVSEDGTGFSEEVDETESETSSNSESQEALHSESGDLFAFNVAENGKAVGSDGVVYDDVAYLSADTVNALDIDAQNAYFDFCDEIAAARNAGNALNDAVVAVDEDGTLVFHYIIPVEALVTAMDELSKERMEALDSQEEAQGNENISQEAEAVETQTTQEAEGFLEETSEASTKDTFLDSDLTQESAAEETVTEELSTEETLTTESVAEESAAEETATEELSTEDTSMTESAAEETVTEELSTEETSMAEAAAEETVTEEETETVAGQDKLTAENMELISMPQAEEFSIAERVKADPIVDLGYESSEIQQLNSILPDADYFKSQLTKNQEAVFNACKGMMKGTNQFRFTASSKLTFQDFCKAISAHIMTYPYQCDWMDLGSISGKKYLDIGYYYYSKSDPTFDFVVTIAKSPYYKSSLVKSSNAKVLELAAQAQEYALRNYPNSPVYGIVEYFDKWICENNYYEELVGVYGGSVDNKEVQEVYYYCHSSYGILLKGYGVCESYALAMTRLLDAVGIPNMYATGQTPGGGHAWNYIQMPDGKWYLQDSTWNDDENIKTSTKDYLLSGDDSQHIPMGNRYKYIDRSDAFQFITRSSSDYVPAKESIALSKNELNLLPKGTAELSSDSKYISNENIPKAWSSSNEKVAKVDKNGKVTAVGPGSAEVTLTAAGMTAVCKVNVHQINSLTFDNGGKASLTASGGIVSGSSKGETQHFSITVNQKAEDPVYTAERLKKDKIIDDFDVKFSDETIAAVTSAFSGDTITLDVTPKKVGKTKITVTFGTKKATLNFSVGEKLNESWFDLKEVEELQKNTKLMYTGKAYKPKVVLSQAGKEKKAKFKVTYKDNKDAGTALVLITGTGSFGGEIRKEFVINPLELKVDTDSIKVSEKTVYNGGASLTKSTVKHLDTSGKKPKKVNLKIGKDYEIIYTKKNAKEALKTPPVEAGEYTMAIVGIGNYAGGANKPVAVKGKDGKDAVWTIEKNDIKKVKVTVKVNGRQPDITVAIGKNVLPKTDYKITYWKDKNCKEPATVLAAKTKYFVKIEGAGSNLTNVKPIIKNFTTK